MNLKPELGEKLFFGYARPAPRDARLPPSPVRTGTVTAVGYRFFTVTRDDDDMDIQFRLDNWTQRTFAKPDFTISRNAL